MVYFTLYPLYRLRRVIALTMGVLILALALATVLSAPSSGYRVPVVIGTLFAGYSAVLLAVWLFLPSAAIGALQITTSSGIILVFLNIRDRIETLGPPDKPLPSELALLSNATLGLGIALVVALTYSHLLARFLPATTGPKITTLVVPDLSPEACLEIMRPEPGTRRGNISCGEVDEDGWIDCSLHMRTPTDWTGAIKDLSLDYRVRLAEEAADGFTLEVDQPGFPANTYRLWLTPERGGCRITTRHETYIAPLGRAFMWLTDGGPDQLMARFDTWRGGRNPALVLRPLRGLFHPLWRPIGWVLGKIFPPKPNPEEKLPDVFS